MLPNRVGTRRTTQNLGELPFETFGVAMSGAGIVLSNFLSFLRYFSLSLPLSFPFLSLPLFLSLSLSLYLSVCRSALLHFKPQRTKLTKAEPPLRPLQPLDFMSGTVLATTN